jgi:hypothetical protein
MREIKVVIKWSCTKKLRGGFCKYIFNLSPANFCFHNIDKFQPNGGAR